MVWGAFADGVGIVLSLGIRYVNMHILKVQESFLSIFLPVE